MNQLERFTWSKHRPEYSDLKIRLLKNIKGFRRDEYWIKPCKTFDDGYKLSTLASI